MSFTFFNPFAKIIINHGNLPHWDQQEATYFITWRTADSIPRHVWAKWRVERELWLRDQGIDPQASDWRGKLEELPEEARGELRRFNRDLEKELDACHGACALKQRHLAQIVADALLFFDGNRYQLADFVVMPNHVHVLVGGLARGRMLSEVESWKKWTALRINEALNKRGRFWQEESFDHLVRHEQSFDKLRRYIRENPAKAGLKPGESFLYSAGEA